MGSVNRLMAAGCPTGTLLNKPESGVVDPADHEGIRTLLGEMALHAEVRIADLQQLVVHAAMRIVTNCAAFTHGFVFEDKGTGLGRMARHAGSDFRHEDSVGQKIGIRISMRIVAVHAGREILRNRVAVRQGKLALYFKVALQAGLGRAARIVDQVTPFAFH